MGYTVYIHRCLANGKVYVGCTSVEPKKRWSYGYKRNARLWADICEYGWDSFEHIVYKKGMSEGAAFKLEQKLIAELKATDPEFGYNGSKGGERGTKGARKFGADNYHAIQVYSPELDQDFGSMTAAALYAGTSTFSIRKCIDGELPFAGKCPFTGHPATWKIKNEEKDDL